MKHEPGDLCAAGWHQTWQVLWAMWVCVGEIEGGARQCRTVVQKPGVKTFHTTWSMFKNTICSVSSYRQFGQKKLQDLLVLRDEKAVSLRHDSRVKEWLRCHWLLKVNVSKGGFRSNFIEEPILVPKRTFQSTILKRTTFSLCEGHLKI